MDWIFVFLQNSYVEALCPKWRYGDGDLLEVIRVKWGHKCGTLMMGLVHLWEETPEMLLTFSLSSQEDSSHQELNYLTHSSGLHSLQNCEKTNLSFKLPVYSILLWQSELTSMLHCTTYLLSHRLMFHFPPHDVPLFILFCWLRMPSIDSVYPNPLMLPQILPLFYEAIPIHKYRIYLFILVINIIWWFHISIITFSLFCFVSNML